MRAANETLVCFALAEEARPFQDRSRRAVGARVLLTGVGSRNAERTVSAELAAAAPSLVLTCGFAGGLDPQWPRGAVLFEPDATVPPPAALVELLTRTGARRARFHCADRVAVTAQEKQMLRIRTGADAVEMESGAIHAVCRRAGVPCLTIRAVSDTAREDLPLDFNRWMMPDGSLDMRKLLLALARSPRLVGPLWRLRQATRDAAAKLANVLERVIEFPPT